MKRPLLHLLVFGAALAGGWWMSRTVAPAVSLRSEPRPPNISASLETPSLEALMNRLEREPSATYARESWLSLIAQARPADLGLLLERLPDENPALMPMLVDYWLKRDPEAFAAVLDQAKPDTDWEGRWSHLFFPQWAEKDAQAAFAAADKMSPERSSWAVARVLGKVLEKDAVEAVRLATRSSSPHLGDFPNTLTRHGETLLARLEEVKNLPPSESRDRALGVAAGALAKTDIQAALRMTESIADSKVSLHARGLNSQSWVKSDPDGARAFVESATASPLRFSVAAYYCLEHASARPAEVIPMTLRWMKGGARQMVLRKAFAALEKTDPAQAAALRETLPRPVPPPEY